jgi:UDP-N-acetylglucosamine 2-epimerase (non-hydrolysing)
MIVKLLFVFGTRPEAIKMLPIIKHAQRFYDDEIVVKVCVTGQHRQMLDQVLSIFGVTPDYDLDIMAQGQDLYDITSKVLLGLRPILLQEQPDCVLVHGDTTTTLAASLAAYYQKIDVAHVEAGLRTHNIYSPWPEEINRTVTGCIAKYHFAPTEVSKENLLKENTVGDIVVVGNSVIDSLLWVCQRLETDSELQKHTEELFCKYKIDFSKKILLVTGHRRENFGAGFINICEALQVIAQKHPEIQIVYPVHPSPNVQNLVHDILFGIDNIYLIEPLDYVPFVYLMRHSYLILTDSGGIQEEASCLNKPILVMRDTTERPEILISGLVKLVGSDKNKIIDEVTILLTNNKAYDKMASAVNPYGNGATSRLILEYLNSVFKA